MLSFPYFSYLGLVHLAFRLIYNFAVFAAINVIAVVVAVVILDTYVGGGSEQ